MRHEDMEADPNRERFIPGVYNYCDHWCERCKVRDRCRVYAIRLAEESGDPATARRLLEPDRPLAASFKSASERLDWETFLDQVNREPTKEELERIEAMLEAQRARQEASPLTVAAREYASITWKLTPALEEAARQSDDPLTVAAIEGVLQFSSMIRVKTRRASAALVSGEVALEFDEDDDHDDEFAMDDANGCVKLVRLAIAESRLGWEHLQSVSAIAPVAADMVNRLSALDDALATAFPNAMAFVRVGLDE